jgi:hypothetical protein
MSIVCARKRRGEGGREREKEKQESMREEWRKRRDKRRIWMTMEVSIDPSHTNQFFLIALVNVDVAFIITGHT